MKNNLHQNMQKRYQQLQRRRQRQMAGYGWLRLRQEREQQARQQREQRARQLEGVRIPYHPPHSTPQNQPPTKQHPQINMEPKPKGLLASVLDFILGSN